ncbi:MAG: hypothetical protein GXO76_15970 [Calditrichaeota bacterium]|nr:hypothetical protein [Calditrichota bacterium]
MKILQLRTIPKLYFGYEDIARALKISPASARVAATRYVKGRLLIRIKRNLYVLPENWANMPQEQKFVLANLIQVPSYISLLTALDYYQISTQMQQDFIESIAIKRSQQVEIQETFFRYVKIKRNLYFGFVRMRGFFIAEPEKALLDALYLMSNGRYRLDMAAIDFDKLDRQKLDQFVKSFPPKTKELLRHYDPS